MRIEPLKTLGPGWRITDWQGSEYTLWAPCPDTSAAGGPSERTYWQTQWCNAESDDGDLARSDNVDEILVIFPVRIAAKFREIIDDHRFGSRDERWDRGELVR